MPLAPFRLVLQSYAHVHENDDPIARRDESFRLAIAFRPGAAAPLDVGLHGFESVIRTTLRRAGKLDPFDLRIK